MLDLFGRNPEFFVAGRHGPGQVVVFGIVVAFAPAAAATLAGPPAPRHGSGLTGQ